MNKLFFGHRMIAVEIEVVVSCIVTGLDDTSKYVIFAIKIVINQSF